MRLSVTCQGMTQPDQPDKKPEQSQPSLGDALERSNRVIAESRAEIARARALSKSEADISREIESLSEEHNRLNGSRKDGA
ncbi:hypothetical protein VB618_00090 [Microvirga sp. CF3062]|uniref:hypothetical protein n=1 Tax=Microvirga sp. CF3062 TaxID=3110182 RepID=UPI002E79B345|nr:hypothetical protein [Microvirga sp. CF3062]MEE1654577.1 hypothetical protein [Microvirga sp. CF3062]